MAHRTPRVEETMLISHEGGAARSIAVGTPAWYAWLEDAATFTFTGPQGSFSARKERRGQAGWYWKAYRKQAGTLHRAYLGKSADLSLDRLQAVARDLAQRIAAPPVGESSTTSTLGPDRGDAPLDSSDLPADIPPLSTANRSLTPTPVQALPLVTTKLYAPPARPQLVPRPRLLARLDAGLHGALTLLSAPAGFGKTTLLSAWRATTAGSGVPLAWVSLDAADSDPLRFWRYVIAALDLLQPDLGATALALLQSPQPPPIEVVLTPLLNALSALPADTVLVLDDYHLIDAPTIHSALMFLIEHLPPQLHLVITTRADPPLPLARLRVRQQLTEIRAADLRFTAEETAAFLTELMELPLSVEHIVALDARTEGWIAGLHLAALAMRERADLPAFVAAFTGSHHFVVDYLAEEVFRLQPPHLQQFLLQTAILDRMCGPLCDALLLSGDEHYSEDAHPQAQTRTVGDPSSQFLVDPGGTRSESYSQIIIEQLEQINLFIIPLDDQRHWYRYHHLFADMLRARLHRGASASVVASLHRRASTWYEQHALLPEAIRHALAAQDWERTARLLEQCAWPVAYRGQIQTVLGWFNALPAAFIQARPSLCVLHALMLIHTDQMETAEARLQEAEQGLLPDTPQELAQTIQGRVLTTRANISFYRGDLPGSVLLGQQALDRLPEAMLLPRAAARAFAAQAFLVTGDVTSAIEGQVAAVAPAARAAGNRFVLLRGFTLLAQLQVLQGRLQAAAATYGEAAQVAPEPGGLQSLIGSAAYYFGLGDLYREWNDLAAAEQHLVDGLERAIGAVTANAIYLGQGFIALARLRQARGDHTGALATLATFADLGHRRSFDPEVLARGAAVQAQLALAQGNLDAALRWASTSGLYASDDLSFPRELEYLTLVRLRIAAGRGEPTAPYLHEALALLDRFQLAAEAGARMGSVIEILVLRALALQAHGNLTGALMALERALTLAAPEGYMRIFVDEGAPMARLLAQVARGTSTVAAYATGLLDAFPSTEGKKMKALVEAQHTILSAHSPALVEPLSNRELEILRLIADGHSNQVIADRLILAVGTVKKHVNNLFSKLDVQSRTQALVRARELNLL